MRRTHLSERRARQRGMITASSRAPSGVRPCLMKPTSSILSTSKAIATPLHQQACTLRTASLGEREKVVLNSFQRLAVRQAGQQDAHMLGAQVAEGAAGQTWGAEPLPSR